MVDVLSCGASNIRSVLNALEFLHIDARIITTPEELSQSTRLIFPGVGNFGYVSRNLAEKGLRESLQKRLKDGMPFLGICLGLQLLFESSEEAPGAPGLAVLPGVIEKLRHPRIPQIGWNRVQSTGRSPLVKDGDAYFVNSYVLRSADPEMMTATTEYGEPFVSAIQKEHITAVQFHPEKSGAYGLELLRSWCQSN